jgi:hypothetical protein
MAFRHSRNADLSFNAQLLGGFCDSIDLNIDVDTSDITVFKQTWHQALSGLANGGIEISGAYDPTVTTGPASAITSQIQNDSVAFIYYPGGNTVGQRSASGNCIVKNYKESSKIGDKVAFSATMVVTGAVTFAQL